MVSLDFLIGLVVAVDKAAKSAHHHLTYSLPPMSTGVELMLELAVPGS